MARTRVKLSHPGMAALLRSPGVAADMLRRAEAVAAAARASAPVQTGQYRDAITAVSATTDRAVGRVVASAAHSLIVEFHTRNLGRSIDAAGS